LADDVEDDIFAADTGRKLAINLYSHILTPLSDDSLRGKNVFDLRCANAECQSAKCAMSRSMAVAADYGRARESEALLRANDMDNALPIVAQSEVCKTEVFYILL
jgi:hypothetical protein